MQIYVAATLGWSPQLILPALTRRAAAGAQVTLHLLYLDPEGDTNAEAQLQRALNEIKMFTGMMNIETLETSLPRTTPARLAYLAAREIAHRIDTARHRPDSLHILAAGGPRRLAVAASLLAAAASHQARAIKGYVVDEQTREEHPIPPIPICIPKGETKLAVAKTFLEKAEAKGAATYEEIAEKLHRDPTTVKRLAQELTASSLLECQRGRPTRCKPTETLYIAIAALTLAEALPNNSKTRQ